MWPRVSSSSSFRALVVVVALVGLVALATACVAPAPRPSVDPNAPIAQTYPVPGGGEIRVTVQRRYPAGQPVVVQLVVTAGTSAVRGPVSARVLSSGIEGEKVIRTLAPSALDARTVAPGGRALIAVTWDSRAETGDIAPKDTYTLTMEFVIGGETVRIGTTIELAAY